MRRKLRTLAAAGAIGVASITGVALIGPALVPASATTANDATPDHQSFLQQRLQDLKKALSGLVSDGTITQKQADTVAKTLNESGAFGPHQHGLRGGPGVAELSLDTAATTLGVTPQELRTALRNGDTLAEVAKKQGVEVQKLVDALVTAATERIDAAVADGRLTQKRADQVKADLAARIAERVNEDRPAHDGFGPGHHRGMGANTGAPSA